jgi:hypothetical protein
VTMTIGAWCLGNAWLAWITAVRWDRRFNGTALLYLWLFGLFEMVVLIVFNDKLRLSHPIAWLYVLTLGANVVVAVWGLMEWMHTDTASAAAGEKPTRAMRVITAAFVVFVAFLAIFGAVRGLQGRGTGDAVFPEPMSAFSVSSFAAFYLALSLSAIPLLWARDRRTLFHHSYASYGLVLIITVATFINIDRFDFSARPLGLLYLGAYIVVALVTAYYLLRYWSRDAAAYSPARGQDL